MFSVVKFPNSECTGQNGYNGTCYTKDECTAKGGSESGSCASGFGICCTFSMTCGSKSTENNTYFEQTTFTTYSGGNTPCVYTICPLKNVCRIKLELNTYQSEKRWSNECDGEDHRLYQTKETNSYVAINILHDSTTTLR